MCAEARRKMSAQRPAGSMRFRCMLLVTRFNGDEFSSDVGDGRFGSWPCKNCFPGKSVRGQDWFGLRPQSQPSAPDDVHHSCQVIGEDRESHLGGYFWKRFGDEVCRPHAGLHRAERMLDRLATLAHGLWVCIKALLHSFEQVRGAGKRHLSNSSSAA